MAALGFGALLLGGAAGRVAISHYGRTLIAVALGGTALVVLVALITRRPHWAVGAIVLALISLPSFQAPVVQHLLFHPMLVLSLIVAVTFVMRSVYGRVRLSGLDMCVIALVVAMLLTIIFGPRSWKDTASQLWLWLPPYLVGRVIASRRPLERTLAVSIVLGGLALAPFTLVEVLGLGSPFFASATGDQATGSSPWDQPHLRGGEAFRAQASFGHPIAYSMFLAVAIVFALVLMGGATERRQKRLWGAAAGVLLLCEAATVSRTGWVALGVAIVLLGAGRAQRDASRVARRAIALAMTGMVGLVLLFPSVAAVPLSIVGLQSDTNDQVLQQTAAYRGGLYEAAFKNHVASWFGNRQSKLAGAVAAGNQSIDSEYLVMLDRWGAVAAIAFVILALAVAARAVTNALSGADDWQSTFAASATGLMAGLASVALITQQEYFVWLLLGLAAAPRSAQPLYGSPGRDGRWRFAERGIEASSAVKTNGALLSPALRRYWWVAAVAAVIAGGATVVIPRLSGPRYEADSALLFQTPQIDQALFGRNLSAKKVPAVRAAATDLQLVALPRVAQLTAAALHDEISARRITREVQAHEVGRSDVYMIRATDARPRVAIRLANTYAAQFLVVAAGLARSDLERSIAEIQARLAAMPAAEQHSGVAGALRRSLSDLAFTATLQTGNVQSIQVAAAAQRVGMPRSKSIGYSAMLGLLVGILLVASIARRERRLTDLEALEDVFAAPVLASIPRLPKAPSVTTRPPTTERANAFGLLRGRLRHLGGQGSVRTVLVTSAKRGDGRTSVAFELAAAEARAGTARVLLLEADLRAPALSSGATNRSGLAEILTGIVPLAEAMYTVDLDEGQPDDRGASVDVIPGGTVPPNPAGLLESQAMLELLEELLDTYHFVVIDSPPLGVVLDSLPLLRAVDGVLVVARPNELRRRDAVALQIRLSGRGARILGVVANLPMSRRPRRRRIWVLRARPGRLLPH